MRPALGARIHRPIQCRPRRSRRGGNARDEHVATAIDRFLTSRFTILKIFRASKWRWRRWPKGTCACKSTLNRSNTTQHNVPPSLNLRHRRVWFPNPHLHLRKHPRLIRKISPRTVFPRPETNRSASPQLLPSCLIFTLNEDPFHRVQVPGFAPSKYISLRAAGREREREERRTFCGGGGRTWGAVNLFSWCSSAILYAACVSTISGK